MKHMIELVEILKAVLFGIVEGITEWLPISSTGHMILVNQFLTFSNDDFTEMFNKNVDTKLLMEKLRK